MPRNAAVSVRRAVRTDIPVLVEFSLAMARESEGRELDPERLRAGVAAVFAKSNGAAYYIAARNGAAVGALLITKEWSDWRNGAFWWLQSVYVIPEARRAGVFTSLYRHVHGLARETSGVCGLRLYVDHQNQGAQQVYRRIGMNEVRYRFFEIDFVLASNKA